MRELSRPLRVKVIPIIRFNFPIRLTYYERYAVLCVAGHVDLRRTILAVILHALLLTVQESNAIKKILAVPWYCTVLYCTVLYCTVLYCTVLYCTVLDCTVLYCTVLYLDQKMRCCCCC